MFKGDQSEPQDILRALSMLHNADFEVHPLNAEGWADYVHDGVECFCHGSFTYNTERKTWGDLANGVEDIEEQLARQVRLHPNAHHRLIIEGVAEPAAQGLLVYSKAAGKNVFMGGLKGYRGASYKSIVGWLAQVRKSWEVVYSTSMAASAIQLGEWYSGDQINEDAHTTFKRMFKSVDYSVNPQAQRILGAAGEVRVGPKTAEAIAARFGTAWRAFKAPIDEWVTIPGVGYKTAQEYLRGIGRGDV